MATHSLAELVQLPFLKGDPTIQNLLQKILKREDAILFVCNVCQRDLYFMDPKCEAKLGYHASEFYKSGYDKIVEITIPSTKPAVIERQVQYTRQAKEPGFDPRSVIISSFPMTMRTRINGTVNVMGLSALLTYSPQADLENAVSIIADNTSKTIAECSDLLEQIKGRHNEIYTHGPLNGSGRPLDLVHITPDRIDLKVSPREQEILALIAKGASSKEIASQLSVSEHTVETHRKNLLNKFEAKNTAELIKKASKVFWLE